MSQKTQNILQICLSSSWGGLEMVSFEFARDFALRGFPITTVCIEGSPLAEKIQKEKLPALILKNQNFFSRMRALSQQIDEQKPDTILCQHLHDLWFLVPLVYFKQIRIVGLSHTFLGVSKKDPFHNLLYGRVDRLICLTGLHKQNLMDHLKLSEEKLEVIPNMVDVDRFTPEKRSVGYFQQKYQIPAGKFLIGVVGRLDEHKGQRESILAMEYLRKYQDRLHLLIVGEDTLNNPGTGKKLKSLVKEKGLHEMISFTGFSGEVEKVMASLDVLLVPSSAETFGRTIIEGMASGVPVIATRAGGVPDIIEDKKSGLLVEPQNSRELAVAIEKLFLNPDLRKQIHTQALTKARKTYARDIVEAQLMAAFSTPSLDSKGDKQRQTH